MDNAKQKEYTTRSLIYSLGMKVSKYQKNKINELQDKAFELYKQGTLTTRQVGSIVGRSCSWVSKSVKEAEKREENKQ